MQGKVEAINKKFGNRNGKQWVLYIVKIGGNDYSAFELPNDIVEGDMVEFEYVQNGKYKNLKSISKVSSGSRPSPKSQAQAKAPAQDYSRYNKENQLSIIRQSSIKAAIDILANNLDVNRVKAIAELLTKYVQEGIDDKELEELIKDYLIEQNNPLNDLEDDDEGVANE